MIRSLPAAALILVVTGCAARTPTHTPGPVTLPTFEEALENPTPREQLRRDLRALFTHSSVEHAQWGVNFYSLGTAETLYSYNAFRFLVPASNQKLLTTAVAAERLGWDYRFTTRLLSTGVLDPDGTLRGDLVVVSNGDPTINPRHPERWAVFDKWAATLHAGGIRIIQGDIVGDDNAFEEPGWGQGWAWDNLQYGYGAQTGALQFNENQIEVSVAPGSEPGARAVISMSPPGSGFIIDHGVTTNTAGGRTSIDIARVPGSTLLRVSGVIAADAKPSTITAAVENPTIFYVNALKDALGRHGIYVAGLAVDIDDLRSPNVGPTTELLVDQSPPLAEIIDVTMKWSRNGYAETLLYALSPPGAPARPSAGLDVMRAQLRTWGIPEQFYLPRDGSGLSRYDYVTADALTWLLTYLWADPKHSEVYRSTLPVAGVSGTIASRLKGTRAEARVWAKTGSLSNVRALSGYMVTHGGEPIVFSILVNNFRVSTGEIDAIVDKALLRVVDFTRQVKR